jgi:hypothetical protein
MTNRGGEVPLRRRPERSVDDARDGGSSLRASSVGLRHSCGSVPERPESPVEVRRSLRPSEIAPGLPPAIPCFDAMGGDQAEISGIGSIDRLLR